MQMINELLSNFVLFEVGLNGFFEWFKKEARIVLFIIAIVVLLVAVVKRSWITAVGSLVGLSLIGIFIIAPESLITLAEWFQEKLSIGGN